MITAQRRYEHTEKGKAALRRYRLSEKGKARRSAQNRRNFLKHREKRLEQMRAYNQTHYRKRLRSHRSMSFWLNQAKEAV